MDWNEFLDYLRTLKTTGDGVIEAEEGEVEVHVKSEHCTLQGRDIKHLLSSAQNVALAYEALGEPSDSGIVITGVEISDEVAEALDAHFHYVEYA